MSDYLEIEEGLKKREFFLEYLPMVELDSGRCVGAEALSRWRKPWGIEQPADFLPSIENTPLSGFLACYVLEEIATDFLAWLKVHDAFISFNIPAEIIGRGGLYYVAERVGLIEIKHKIVLEVVERGVPDRTAVEALNRAAAAGIRIALDDVATGGANAIVLSRCNVEMIKLDRQLVSQVRPGEPLPGELAAIVPLLKTGGVNVVAEGVESADQAEALRSAGFRLAQGFHFSRPLSADAFKAFFAQRSLASVV
jgi:EAL domain-containing protein (putative c-di-GMP-specific phosphodiesterase class I)